MVDPFGGVRSGRYLPSSPMPTSSSPSPTSRKGRPPTSPAGSVRPERRGNVARPACPTSRPNYNGLCPTIREALGVERHIMARYAVVCADASAYRQHKQSIEPQELLPRVAVTGPLTDRRICRTRGSPPSSTPFIELVIIGLGCRQRLARGVGPLAVEFEPEIHP